MKPTLLQFVPYEHPSLRKKTQEVTFPLSSEDEQTISNMLYSIQKEQLQEARACFESAAGMAANQWGIDKRIFIFCPLGNESDDIEIVINPSYKAISPDQNQGWEGCFSVPNASGDVTRYESIQVKYQDQTGTWQEKELNGWAARVWQHENDHLDGFLFDSPLTGKCKEKVSFNSEQELEDFYYRVKEERKS